MEPTKGELREAIKRDGLSAVCLTLPKMNEAALLDGMHGRPHTRGRGDYWRLGRELAGLDKADA